MRDSERRQIVSKRSGFAEAEVAMQLKAVGRENFT